MGARRLLGFPLALLLAAAAGCGVKLGPNACAAIVCASFFRGSEGRMQGADTRTVYGERVRRCRGSCGAEASRCAAGCGIDEDPAGCEATCARREQACLQVCMPPDPID